MLMILRQISNVRESRRAHFYRAIPTLTALKRRGLIGWDNSHRWLKLDNFVSLTNAGRETLKASGSVERSRAAGKPKRPPMPLGSGTPKVGFRTQGEGA